MSPCEGIAISQDVLETVLRQHLQQRDLVRLHIGWRFTGLTVDEHAGTCTSLIADRGGETRQIRSRFVVGADGWRSDVRTLAGIGVEGRPDLGRMRSVRFSGELSRWLGNPPPAFVRLTGSGAALLATHADGRWVLILPHGRDSEPEEPGAFVAKALAVDASVTVLEDTTWTAAVQQATRFGQGNVLLVGDAAHRVTPAGATGITSGMADAANIAWKLAATLQGWGGPQLVPSYAQEREPVAEWIGAANLRMWTDAQDGTQTPIELRWLEFGYRYRSAVIDPVPPDTDNIDLASTFTPRAQPGDRAPHARLADGRSTIDLSGHDFTLLTTDNPAEWTPAVARARTNRRPPLTLVSDSGGDVRAAFRLRAGEAVLIRPDGHIAWRSDTPAHPDHTTTVEAAIARATGW